MKTAIVGGGPGGLYLAILLRKRSPEHQVVVLERNRPGDAYGFGVVFSDETLDHFADADESSFEELAAKFVQWGDIEVRHASGRRIVSGGHGFAAASRQTLLEILARRALELGVEIRFESEVTDISTLEADVIVGADGANSPIRKKLENHLRPTVDWRVNKYAWFGTPKVFERFHFIFVDTPVGMVWAHIYPYSDQGSTFIAEMAPETWRQLGLDRTEDETFPPGTSDQLALEMCQEIFAEHLDGQPLIGNNSKWLQFPTISCQRWHHGNVVLLGDAIHTAHFSVGSGTKLAMEDAISLAQHLTVEQPLGAAFEAYGEERRSAVDSLQRAAKASLEWFEGADRYRDLEPEQFTFSLLTRSQRVTYDNLRLRDAGYMAAVDRWYASSDHGSPTPVGAEVPPMFHPFEVRDLTLNNRIVVSPMDQYSASDDGVPGDWHLVHLGSRAVGGAGLVMTEMTCVSPEGRISPADAGLWSDDQEAAWTRVVRFVHENTTARIGLQLGHSGRKGSTKKMWEGDTEPLEEGNWEIISPSPIRYRPESQVPREMTRADMDLVREQFVESARRGARAGFDLLEIHFAHGYLLSSFLTPVANHRSDEYGGSLENRMRYPLEVFDAVRSEWPAGKPMSVRISATDWVAGGFDGDDAVSLARALKDRGCDLIDVSTGQTSFDARPEYGRLYQTPFSDRIRQEVGIPTMTVGAVASIDDVHNILVSGRADLCLLARPHLVDPYWTLNAAIDLGYTGHDFPDQYLSGLGARRREQDPIAPEVFRR